MPNVVLFPRAVLPLHVFEPRYRQMTADVLTGDKLIAMALLKEGWQKTYHGRPEIYDVVCVGKVIGHEMLDDGRYNLLLEGSSREDRGRGLGTGVPPGAAGTARRPARVRCRPSAAPG
ncbi:MAG: LON peptidase substrate-binding domain-containing protein [Tepidisphaeraceae bacterium]